MPGMVTSLGVAMPPYWPRGWVLLMLSVVRVVLIVSVAMAPSRGGIW